MGDVVKIDERKEVFIIEDEKDPFEYETVEVGEQLKEPLTSEEEPKPLEPSELAELPLDIDPKDKDLIWALTRPANEMTDEELLNARQRLRELRTVKIGTMKKKSTLDLILAQLTPEQSASILKQFEALQAAKEAKATEEKA
jgi:hypothetical protein